MTTTQSSTVVRVGHEPAEYHFDSPAEAARFADELNAVVVKWLPWSQAMLGSFAEVGDA